jgi:hypothetical protein
MGDHSGRVDELAGRPVSHRYMNELAAPDAADRHLVRYTIARMDQRFSEVGVDDDKAAFQLQSDDDSTEAGLYRDDAPESDGENGFAGPRLEIDSLVSMIYGRTGVGLVSGRGVCAHPPPRRAEVAAWRNGPQRKGEGRSERGVRDSCV